MVKPMTDQEIANLVHAAGEAFGAMLAFARDRGLEVTVKRSPIFENGFEIDVSRTVHFEDARDG